MTKKIIFILGLALFLRLIALNQSLWLDEGTTALVARDMTWIEFWGFLKADFHPPLYYIIVKAVSGLVGNYSEIVLRMPSVVFGVLTVYLVYKIAIIRKTNNAVLASLLMASAPLHIYYSQEARMYATAAFFVALAFYFYLKKQNLCLLGALALAFWTDYMTIFVLPVFLLMRRSRPYAIASIFTCLPMLLFLPDQLTGGSAVSANWARALGDTNLKNILLIPVKFLIGRISFARPVYLAVLGLTLLAILPAIFGAFKNIKKNSELYPWLALPVFAGLVVGLFVPVVSYFRFLFVLPAFYLILAEAPRKYIFILFVLNLTFSAIYLLSPNFHREDWRSLVTQAEEIDPEPLIIFPAETQMEAYKYYASKSNFAGPFGIDDKHAQIWLMRYVYDIVDPDDATRKKIETMGYEKISELDFNGVVVYQYENRN